MIAYRVGLVVYILFTDHYAIIIQGPKRVHSTPTRYVESHYCSELTFMRYFHLERATNGKLQFTKHLCPYSVNVYSHRKIINSCDATTRNPVGVLPQPK